MDIVTQNTVIHQVFSLLPFHLDSRSVFDRYTKKLTTAKSIALFTIALLDKWSSYAMMETKLRANENLQNALALQEISGSQLSRKLNDIPTEFLQALFLKLVAQLNQQTVGDNGISEHIGKLGIVDSTALHLPFSIGAWARLSSHDSSVKMHLRLIVASPETMYPDHMIPTTRNYDDREIALEMVTDLDVTYVMDRGYVKYATMDTWVVNKTLFAMRVNNTHITTIIEEREIPKGTRIRRDAIVRLGKGSNAMKENVRLIEFEDEKGRFYRVITTRYDLSAEEVANIYRHRWLIELFFKWMKQHLRLVKLFSYKPQAVWNQMFMVLIGYLLVLILRKKINTPKKAWDILRTLSAHLEKTWASFIAEVNREPTKQSKGRQRTLGPQPAKILPEGIGRIKLQGERKARKPRKSKKK